MNKNLTPWRKSRRSLWLAGLPFLAASVALAQTAAPADTTPDEALKLEKFVVTGSLIPIAADTPAVPVTVMTAAQIANSGVTSDLTDVLKKTQPFFFGRANIGSDNANTRAGSTACASTVALRNRSTLILINGRRAAISPTAAVGGGQFVDVSLIPLAAVERVEILSDGASATYGTDAVSGVVNVILKTNYNGAELGGSYNWAPDAGNWASRSAYLTVGAGNDRTQLTVSAEWRRTDPLYQYERPWGSGIFLSPSYAGIVNTTPTDFYHLNPSLNAPGTNLDLAPADLVAAGVYAGAMTQDQATRFFDLSRYSTMILKTARRSLSFAAEHRWSDSLTVFGDLLITQSLTENSLNAQPVSAVVPAANPSNPFNVSVTARNRFVTFPRLRSTDTLGARGVFGLKGSFGDSWTWEAAASLNRSVLHIAQKNLIDAASFNAALANGTLNLFARQQAPGVIEAMLGTGYQDFTSRLNSFDARVTGSLFELPAGTLQAGFGVESRQERVAMVNDRQDRLGLWLQATPTNPFAAKQAVDAVFAEVRAPIFGTANARPGLSMVEISLAARKEIYSSTTDPLVPKFSLRWLPFNDEFAVRGTYSESFSAPNLFSLFGPTNAGFTSSINLQRYNPDGTAMGVATGNRQYRSRGGSNANLKPSESRNWTAGFVWSPRAIKGLSLSVDWFNIDERDLVGAIPQATLLQSVEQFGTASPYASQVRIAPSIAGEARFDDGAPITGPGQITSGASDAVWMTNPVTNIAGNWQSGADVRIDYAFETGTWGRFNAGMSMTYLHDYVQQSLPTSAPVDFSDTFSGTSTYPRFRTFTQLDWTFKSWSAGLSHTYLPEVTDIGAATPVKVESYHSFDLRLGYRFSGSANRWLKGLELRAGVNNVFSEDPPLMPGEQDQARDINTYDPFGRMFYVSAKYKF